MSWHQRLAWGSTGVDVSKLQAVLNYHRRGPTDDVLGVDGIFGPLTQRRVRGFLSTNQLAVDGVVGPNTAAALMTICSSTAKYVATRDEDFAIEVGDGPDQPTVTRQ